MYKIGKRLFDLLSSSIALLCLSPLLIPICIALRLTAEGYVFYFQKRIGLDNKRFDIWKFATMLKNSPNIGTGTITLRNDPRVTPVGKYLRKSKLNELPQIMNVILGEMSIVGPRPLDDKAFGYYPLHVQDRVYQVKPGITGIGSIVFRDEEQIISASGEDPHEFYRKNIAPYKGELELWYQEKASFTLDLAIIFLTIWVVFFPQTNMHFKLFKDLPPKPKILRARNRKQSFETTR